MKSNGEWGPIAQTDCRFFTGYKPCGKSAECSPHCPQKQIAEPRILVIHLEALGAVLRATVLLPAIRRRWPRAHVTWITSSTARPLLQNNQYIDRLLPNTHDGCLALSALSFEVAICVDKNLSAVGLLRVPISCGRVLGFKSDPKTGAIVPANSEALRLYELGLSDHEKFFVNRAPENRLLVEAMGLDFKNDHYVFEFTDEEKKFADAERGRLGLKNAPAVIGLNTGCSNVIPYKKFSVTGWTKIIHALQKRFQGAIFVLLGGPEDTQRNEQIATAMKGSVIATPTTEGLRRGMLYVSLCDVVVTGDSLGMHMAIALKKETVAWFGPTCAHEIDFYGRGEAVLTKAPCSPCWKRHCDKPLMCYDQVDLSEIVSAVERALKRARPDFRPKAHFSFVRSSDGPLDSSL